MRNVLILALVLIAPACYKKAEVAQPSKERGAAEPAAAATSVEVGQPMPAYSAAMLDGSSFDIAAERGNVVLLNLWATWCGPCRFEIPELEKLHQEHAAKKFKVVGISIDEELQPVKDFAAEKKIAYPLAHDPQAKLANLFQVTVVPTSVLVDREGKIVWKHAGIVEANDAALVKALETALR